MNCIPAWRHGLLVLTLGLAALPTSASDDCDAPVSHWQSREALRQWASAQGWQIKRLKIDDGCYEIRGTDAQGRAFKAKVDPETLKVLKLRPDHPKHGREHDRDDAEPARRAPTPPPEGAGLPAPAPASRPAPRGTAQ